MPGNDFKQRINPPGIASLRAALSVMRLVGLGTVLAACASMDVDQHPEVVAPESLPEFASIEACQEALASDADASAAALDGSNIRLVNWNIKKKSIPNWREDYGRLTGDKDLILIQEASLREDTINELPTIPYWSFAPGYWNADSITGVLTLSRVEPVTHCSFVTTEPLLRTPKATNVTEFVLAGRNETLLVINVHAVNFSFGLGTYKHQFELISQVLAVHSGPVILAGDLNTWRKGRVATIDALADKHSLEPLEFEDDQRTRVFGHILDHIYVRGLEAKSANAFNVTSSDHSPMSAVLTM